MKNIKKILYVEDNPRDRELTLSALEEFNLVNEIICVQDGEEALNYLFKKGKYAGLENDSIGAILLDIKMPKIDGIEVLRRIKSDDKLKLIPVVMLTSSREERDLVESYSLGVNAYVVKPVDFMEFINAIKSVGLFWAILNETPE